MTWTRWGRVGDHGQSSLLGDGSLAGALGQYEKKFKDKSGLSWDNRGDDPRKGKYAYVERSYEPDTEDEEDQPTAVNGYVPNVSREMTLDVAFNLTCDY
jgi:poly [ADP-ribose] polymerase